MITRRVPLAETPAEIARLAEDPGDDVKVLVDVRHEPERQACMVLRAGSEARNPCLARRPRRSWCRCLTWGCRSRREPWSSGSWRRAIRSSPSRRSARSRRTRSTRRSVAPADGVLTKILVQVDEDVAVGAPLAELAVEGEAAVLGTEGAADTDSADATQEDRQPSPTGERRFALAVRRTPPGVPSRARSCGCWLG